MVFFRRRSWGSTTARASSPDEGCGCGKSRRVAFALHGGFRPHAALPDLGKFFDIAAPALRVRSVECVGSRTDTGRYTVVREALYPHRVWQNEVLTRSGLLDGMRESPGVAFVINTKTNSFRGEPAIE